MGLSAERGLIQWLFDVRSWDPRSLAFFSGTPQVPGGEVASFVQHRIHGGGVIGPAFIYMHSIAPLSCGDPKDPSSFRSTAEPQISLRSINETLTPNTVSDRTTMRPTMTSVTAAVMVGQCHQARATPRTM